MSKTTTGFVVEVDNTDETADNTCGYVEEVINQVEGAKVVETYDADERERVAKSLVETLGALNRQLAEDEDQDTSQLHDDIFVAAQALVEHMGFTVKSEGDFTKDPT